jgi:hypothetical protein
MSIALTEEEVRAFVGSNSEYYLQAWAPALSGRGRGSRFNGAAFLVPVLWLGYRKMYLPMFIFYVITAMIQFVLILGLFVGVLEKSNSSSALDLVAMALAFLGMLVPFLVAGFVGNRLYLARARRVIEEIRSQGLPQEDQLKALSRRGGTSSWAVFVLLGFFIVGEMLLRTIFR